MEPEVWIAGTSLVVSIAALFLSLRSNHRAQITTRAQLFLNLRSRFLEVLQNLPENYADPNWVATTANDRAAAFKYWHHTFDEWYITNKLDRRLMFKLWESFYCNAILEGLRHTGLRKTLISMMQQGQGLPQYFPEFESELQRIWSKSHQDNNSKCSGLECDHWIQNETNNTLNKKMQRMAKRHR